MRENELSLPNQPDGQVRPESALTEQSQSAEGVIPAAPQVDTAAPAAVPEPDLTLENNIPPPPSLVSPPSTDDGQQKIDELPAVPVVSIPPHKPVETKLTSAKTGKFSLLQIALVAGVAISAAFLTYSLVNSKSSAVKSLQANAAQARKQMTENREQRAENPPSSRNEEPLSLQLAEDLYSSKDYDNAFNICTLLRNNLAARDMELVKDFLTLRMALCLKEKGDFDRANKLFREVAESRSPVLQALANYQSSLLELNAGQYLKARTKIYKAVALTGALTFDRQWAIELEHECVFLSAEAITRQVLLLCDADKDLPSRLWIHPELKDPLAQLDETQLKTVLSSGVEALSTGLLAPQIRMVDSSSSARQSSPQAAPSLQRWTIICNGPGIEELMARFASNASVDVKWANDLTRLDSPDASQARRTKPGPGWNRPVIMYLSSASIQQATAAAAGTVGLLADVDAGTGTITIIDPAQYSSLSEHTRMLNEHAIWLWRQLLLMYGEDSRVPNAHFILGLLHSRKEQPAEALAEYKLTVNRYSQSYIAPFALMNSGRIKTTLKNYDGAISDLKLLIEQYPDNELVSQANLDLAQTTMNAGFFEKASSLYKKVYNLGFSTESKTVAAFGAGKCLYQLNDYESAIKWLNRYINSVKEQAGETQTQSKNGPNPPKVEVSPKADNLYTAWFLLGKAHLALGNLKQACDALRRTAQKAADSDEYVDAISALVETQISQQDFIAALASLDNISARPFSEKQLTGLLLLKSSILREIGLTDKSITMLAERAQYIYDPRLKADISLELARCHLAAGNLAYAREYLTQAISLFEPGPLSQQVSFELADVCLKLGDYEQTISICSQLIDSSTSQQLKQQASKVLASAYSKQQQYDKAAQTLLMASK